MQYLEFLNNVGDTNEGIASKFNPEDGVEFKVKDPVTDEWHIIKDFIDLRIHSNHALTKNIFCMYAPSIKQDQKYSHEEIENILKLPEEVGKLGKYLVVIKKPKIFFERLEKEVVNNRK